MAKRKKKKRELVCGTHYHVAADRSQGNLKLECLLIETPIACHPRRREVTLNWGRGLHAEEHPTQRRARREGAWGRHKSGLWISLYLHSEHTQASSGFLQTSDVQRTSSPHYFPKL
jgi:hypothetical protein